MKKGSLYTLTFISVFLFFVLLALFVFGVSGTFTYWKGWGFLLSFSLPTLYITLYFLYKDPSLIERRVKQTETRPQQIVGQSFAGLLELYP